MESGQSNLKRPARSGNATDRELFETLAPSAPVETMAFNLSGDSALIVGGYGAIGLAIARRLHSLGVNVLIAGRDERRAHSAAASISQDGLTAIGAVLDAVDKRSIDEVLGKAESLDRPIRILVNCVSKQIERPLLEVRTSDFSDVHSSTLLPALLLTQCLARHQMEYGLQGSHVHLLSLRALYGVQGRGYASFASAKAAHLNLVRQSALELAEYGIRVNGVAPGVVLTHKNEKRFDDPVQYKLACDQIPLRRLARPTDVANAVAFLSSDLSSFITGQVLLVDGGQTAHQQ